MTIYKFTARFGRPPDVQTKTGWIVLKEHHDDRFIRALMGGSSCTIAEITPQDNGIVLKLTVDNPYQVVTECKLDPCFVSGERIEFRKNSRAYKVHSMPIEPFEVGDLVYCPCSFVM
jgi:hypothetical protein